MRNQPPANSLLPRLLKRSLTRNSTKTLTQLRPIRGHLADQPNKLLIMIGQRFLRQLKITMLHHGKTLNGRHVIFQLIRSLAAKLIEIRRLSRLLRKLLSKCLAKKGLNKILLIISRQIWIFLWKEIRRIWLLLIKLLVRTSWTKATFTDFWVTHLDPRTLFPRWAVTNLAARQDL